MSLAICLSTREDNENEREYLNFFLENNGYYWFMFPFFKNLAADTREMIDLYGYAKFFDKNLDILETHIKEISATIKDMPANWEVNIGKQFKPNKKELFSLVSKTTFEELVNNFLDAIKKAKKENKVLVFDGD